MASLGTQRRLWVGGALWKLRWRSFPARNLVRGSDSLHVCVIAAGCRRAALNCDENGTDDNDLASVVSRSGDDV
jgi:hypothetical protein